MAQELQVTPRRLGQIMVLDLRGDVTMFANTELTRAYRLAVDTGAHDLVLNFGGTEYINSAGIAIIITLLTEARAGGITLVLCRLSSHYQKIFRMVGLTRYTEVFASEEDAVQELQSRATAEPT